MQRYIDADKFIAELCTTYKGSMAEISIMPMGLENWINQRAQRVPEVKEPRFYEPTERALSAWNEQINDLHAKGDLDSTIKELAVICNTYEKNHMDHLQTDCYKRALSFLVEFQKMLNE